MRQVPRREVERHRHWIRLEARRQSGWDYDWQWDWFVIWYEAAQSVFIRSRTTVGVLAGPLSVRLT
jgi:hypothetical protein